MAKITQTELQVKLAYDGIATILSGQTDSNEIDLLGMSLCGFFMPETFTGTTITFKTATESGGTFLAIADVTKTVAVNQYIPIDPADFAGVQVIKLVADSQGADAAITLAVRQLS